MSTPTPPTSDAIAQANERLMDTRRRRQAVEELICLGYKWDGNTWEQPDRAREIAAQPGEGDLAVAIASALADFDGVDEASLHALRWSYGAQPEPMGDAWCMDYLPRGEAIARLLATRSSPPHVADALDGERFRKLRTQWNHLSTGASNRILDDFGLGGEAHWTFDKVVDHSEIAIDAAIAARAEAGGES